MGNLKLITNYQLPITNHQLPITNYQLPIMLKLPLAIQELESILTFFPMYLSTFAKQIAPRRENSADWDWDWQLCAIW